MRGKTRPRVFQVGIVAAMEKTPSSLRDMREKLGIKQADAAAYAGISRSHLSKIEHGQDPMSFEVAFKLSVLYKVGLDEILPPEHDLAGVELVKDPAEKGVLSALRRLPDDEKHALVKLLTGRTAA